MTNMSLGILKFCSFALTLSFFLIVSRAQSLAGSASGAGPDTASVHDGQHDFDSDFGTWKTHSSRLLHPLSGSTTWADSDGITVVRKVWDGRANLAEYKADGPSSHVELLSLRYYNPNAKQWGLIFATLNAGTLSVPCIVSSRMAAATFTTRRSLTGNTFWFTFRHTFSTLLKADGEDVKVVQELLRHATARMTLDTYTQALSDDKRAAQSKLVGMIRPQDDLVFSLYREKQTFSA